MGVKECPEILYSTTEKKQQQTNKQKKAGLKFIREVVKAFGNLKFCFCIATKSYRKFYWIINQRRPSWTLESEWPVWVWLLRKNKGVCVVKRPYLIHPLPLFLTLAIFYYTLNDRAITIRGGNLLQTGYLKVERQISVMDCPSHHITWSEKFAT